jgi:hypothetical protein
MNHNNFCKNLEQQVNYLNQLKSKYNKELEENSIISTFHYIDLCNELKYRSDIYNKKCKGISYYFNRLKNYFN